MSAASVKRADVEEWRVIADFPDYAVSSHGNIVRVRADSRNHALTGKPLKANPGKSGYLALTLCRDGKHFRLRVNRIVCEAFHGAPPSPRHHAAHGDGDRKNNRANNLRWATGVENEADKRLHGTAAIGDRHWSKAKPERRSRGEAHGRSKLSESDVRAIRSDHRFQRTIAADYGVSQRVIWMVKNKITWGHVV